jgi:hypothetical protein
MLNSIKGFMTGMNFDVFSLYGDGVLKVVVFLIRKDVD